MSAVGDAVASKSRTSHIKQPALIKAREGASEEPLVPLVADPLMRNPQSSVILNPRLLQNNHHYIYLPDKWQQNAQSFTTRVHVQTQVGSEYTDKCNSQCIKIFFLFTP